MAFDKPFLDIDKQLDLLESRNLIIPNRDRAKRIIMTSSYYDLINGYKSVFMSSNDKFKSNVQLEDIYIFSFMLKGKFESSSFTTLTDHSGHLFHHFS